MPCVWLSVGVVAAAPRRCLVGLCLSCAAARLVSYAAACTAPLRAHTHRGRVSLGAPTPRAPGRGGPRCPSCSSPARYARARQGAGGLRESGSRLRRAFFSAAALASFGRLPLSLIVRIASRSRALLSPFCRGSVGAPSWRCTVRRHRKSGSALKAVRGFVSLRRPRLALVGFTDGVFAHVRPSPPFLLLARVLRVLGAGAPSPQPPF